MGRRDCIRTVIAITIRPSVVNRISAVRCAFEFGYKDHPKEANPALGPESFRILKRDRPKVDPFTIEEAEQLICASMLNGESRIFHQTAPVRGNFLASDRLRP
jgi:hypothetical protein